jgi:hypothetical protein
MATGRSSSWNILRGGSDSPVDHLLSLVMRWRAEEFPVEILEMPDGGHGHVDAPP